MFVRFHRIKEKIQICSKPVGLSKKLALNVEKQLFQALIPGARYMVHPMS